jgi:hypothetical protein
MMNERIKELAEQAGADFMRRINYNNLEGKEYEEDAGVIFESNDSFEKFAELIVRECIEQLVKEGDAWEQFSRNPPQGQETNASAALFTAYRLKEDAVSRLEEHFGVK